MRMTQLSNDYGDSDVTCALDYDNDDDGDDYRHSHSNYGDGDDYGDGDYVADDCTAMVNDYGSYGFGTIIMMVTLVIVMMVT